jgi:uncharacterized protein
MQIDFDPKKDQLNVRRHGCSLADARLMNWDDAMSWIDDRFHYDESRMNALGLNGDRVYYVSHIDRGGVRRVFSMRSATRQEMSRYV